MSNSIHTYLYPSKNTIYKKKSIEKKLSLNLTAGITTLLLLMSFTIKYEKTSGKVSKVHISTYNGIAQTFNNEKYTTNNRAKENFFPLTKDNKC